jgi:hypothetical protein
VALDSEGLQAGAQLVKAHIENASPARHSRAMQPVDGRAARLDRAAKAQPFEHAKPGLLQHQARPDRRGRREPVEQLDPVTQPRQEGG